MSLALMDDEIDKKTARTNTWKLKHHTVYAALVILGLQVIIMTQLWLHSIVSV
jgi:hypothetical protein